MKALLAAVLLVGACSSSSAAGLHSTSSARTASPAASVTPVAGTYAVIEKDFLEGGLNYTLSIVGTDGKVVASANPLKRSVRMRIPNISTSKTAVYYLDGDSDVHYLRPDGSAGRATSIHVGPNQLAAFAVTWDDTRIAVSILDFGRAPVGTRLYVEDLNGAGHHVELFSSLTVMEWPVGWHNGHLVIAVGNDQPINGGEWFERAPAGYHVADAQTGRRIFTLCVGGSSTHFAETKAGAICSGGMSGGMSIVTWDGATIQVYSVKLASGPTCAVLGPLSPTGLIATTTVVPDATQCGGHRTVYVVAQDGMIDPRAVTSIGEPVGWTDNSHIVVDAHYFDGASDPELSIVDWPRGESARVEAPGFLAAVLPGGL